MTKSEIRILRAAAIQMHPGVAGAAVVQEGLLPRANRRPTNPAWVAPLRHSDFGLLSSFVIRHSSFSTKRPLKTTALALLLALLSRTDLLACAACYGQSDSPLAEGMNMGILFMLGCVAVVLGGFAGFFIFLARRSASVAATRRAAANSLSPS